MKIQLPAIDVGIMMKFGTIFAAVFFAAFIGTSCSFLESSSIAMVAFASAILLNKAENAIKPMKQKLKSKISHTLTEKERLRVTPDKHDVNIEKQPATSSLSSKELKINKDKD